MMRAWAFFTSLVASIALSHALCWAGGGSDVGGGGSIIVLPDDRVVLADPYRLHPDSSEIGDLSPELRGELDRAGRILVRLGATVADPRPAPPIPIVRKPVIFSRSGQAAFIRDEVFSNLVEYHFVSVLPFNCRDSSDTWQAPDGAKLELVACTKRKITWIRADLFKRMSVREQAKLIIHERLHSFPDQPHEVIVDLTSGLELMLNLVNAQIAGDRARLDGSQIDLIRLLMRRIEQAGLAGGRLEQDELHFVNNYLIWPEGGGLVHKDAKLAPDVFVGAGSLLTGLVTAGSGTEIVYSSCYFAGCDFGARSKILTSIFEPGFGDDFAITPFTVRIGEGVRLRGAQLTGSLALSSSGENAAEIYEGASVTNSSLTGLQTFRMAPGAAVTGAAVSLVIERNRDLELSLAEKSTLSQLVLSPVIFGGPKLTVQKARISLDAGRVIDFGMESVCRPDQLFFLAGDLNVDSRDALRASCAKR